MIKERIRIKDLEPDAFTAMYGLVKYLDHSQLNPAHKKLMMIRASQINGCAYCIDMHTIEARRAGETEQRIYALSAWRDTPFFSEQERALLALTEEVTLIAEGVSDHTYEQALHVLGENALAQAIMAIVVINSWNRMMVSTKTQPVHS